MEASASAPAAADDPFAGAPAAASDDPFAEGAAPPADVPPADVAVEEPPVVDREGEPVAQTAVPPNPHPTPPPPLSKAERERAAAAQATGGGEAAEAPAQPPVEPQTEGEDEQPAPQPPVEPQEAPEQPVEPQEAPAGGEPPQEPPAATGAGESGGGDEPEPEPATGKQTRLYKLLYQTGETTWEETTIPDEYVEVVPDEVHGPQRFLKARNNDHARRLAFHIHDRPTAGVTIVPVPASSWKPKRVKPAPPRPERERLEIE